MFSVKINLTYRIINSEINYYKNNTKYILRIVFRNNNMQLFLIEFKFKSYFPVTY